MTEFFRDLFNGTGGTDLDAHAPNVGGAWSNLTAGNILALNGGGFCENTVNAVVGLVVYENATAPPGADYDLEIGFADFAMTEIIGAMIRESGTDGYYLVYNAALVRFELGKHLSGIFTLLATQAYDLSTGLKTAHLTGSGDQITMAVDGFAPQTVTDADIAGPGKIAAIAFGAAPGMDNGLALNYLIGTG